MLCYITLHYLSLSLSLSTYIYIYIYIHTYIASVTIFLTGAGLSRSPSRRPAPPRRREAPRKSIAILYFTIIYYNMI